MLNVEIVLVTGTPPNVCGHLILHVENGNYFHFDGPMPTDYPQEMTEFQYRNYLVATHKRELARRKLVLPCPERAQEKLAQLMSRKWTTFLVAHNCGTFIAEIVRAGGNFWAISQHCPTVDTYVELFFDRAIPKRRLEVSVCR